MFNLKTTLATAAIAVAATSSFASPAIASQCPTPGASDLANAPTMPKGVTDDVIGSIDLKSEIGVDARQLRTRRLVVQPGGIVPLRRPAPTKLPVRSARRSDDSGNCARPYAA